MVWYMRIVNMATINIRCEKKIQTKPKLVNIGTWQVKKTYSDFIKEMHEEHFKDVIFIGVRGGRRMVVASSLNDQDQVYLYSVILNSLIR
jgi:hypothetical protein